MNDAAWMLQCCSRDLEVQSEAAMRIRGSALQVVIEGEHGHEETIEVVGCLERGALRPEELGLTLCEAKQLLHGVQQTVVTEQVEQYLAQRAV
jgi:4-hydroxy-3-methylbut-2-enyl diphosphate reductase IspH